MLQQQSWGRSNWTPLNRTGEVLLATHNYQEALEAFQRAFQCHDSDKVVCKELMDKNIQYTITITITVTIILTRLFARSWWTRADEKRGSTSVKPSEFCHQIMIGDICIHIMLWRDDHCNHYQANPMGWFCPGHGCLLPNISPGLPQVTFVSRNSVSSDLWTCSHGHGSVIAHPLLKVLVCLLAAATGYWWARITRILLEWGQKFTFSKHSGVQWHTGATLWGWENRFTSQLDFNTINSKSHELHRLCILTCSSLICCKVVEPPVDLLGEMMLPKSR